VRGADEGVARRAEAVARIAVAAHGGDGSRRRDNRL
jgi:hypothetical protein